MLPEVPNGGNIVRKTQTEFGGMDARPLAGNGVLRAADNMTSDYLPALRSCAAQPVICNFGGVKKPNGMYWAGKLYFVDGTALKVFGEDMSWSKVTTVGTVTDSEKVMCALGDRLVIWPDKVIVTKEGTLDSLEASYTAEGLVFGDGTYAGESAEGNSITTAGEEFPFKVGDGVTISGCGEEANNVTAIIREISEDKKTLRFYENTFTPATEAGEVTIKREVPDLDWLCANENRLWGVKGDTIRCCKLGDPYNWNVFDGISTDAWSVEAGSPGDFTGAAAYLGYPVLFKEDKIYKVYGNKPTNFELMSSATQGVKKGSGHSLAVAGETLFYLGPTGIMAYSGGMPSRIDEPLNRIFTKVVGGSDGDKYYAAWHGILGDAATPSYTQGNLYGCFVWDPRRSAWMSQRIDEAVCMARGDGLYSISSDGRMTRIDCGVWHKMAGGNSYVVPSSSVEFGPFDWSSFGSKYPISLKLRLRAYGTAKFEVALRADGQNWVTVKKFTHAGGVNPVEADFVLSVPIRRCSQYSVKIYCTEGWGWTLYGMEHEFYIGQKSRRE